MLPPLGRHRLDRVTGQFHNRWLILMLFASLAVRLGWGQMQPAEVDVKLPDQVEYVQLGRNLLHEHNLSFFDPRFGERVYAYRTPGYPMLIAALGGKLRLVRAAQAVLDASTVLAAYLLARRWMGTGESLMAGWLVAVNPFLIYFSGLILSETLFTAMLAWGVVLLAWRPNFVWGGLVLALSVLVRPSALLLPVILGFCGVFVGRVRGEIVRKSWFRLPVGLTMLLLTGLVLFPWALRNRAVLGKWVFLTTNGGITQFDGFHEGATGASDQRFVNWPEMKVVVRMSEVGRDQFFSQLATQYIRETWREEPMRLVRLTLWKIGRTWSPVPLSAEYGGRRVYFLAGLVYSIPLDVLVVLGIWRGRIPRSAKALLLAGAVYFTIVHALSVGSLRYRIPVEPLLAVLAAAGAMMLVQSWRSAIVTRER